MSKYGIALLLFALLGLATASAETELVRFPKGKAKWNIKISPSPDSEFAQDELNGEKFSLREVEVIQDKRKYRHRSFYKNQGVKESWGLVGMGQIVTEDPNGTLYFTNDKPAFDVSDLAWLKQRYLQSEEPEDFEDRECHYYKAKIKQYSANGKYLGTLNYQAWIDVETLLPVAFDNGVQRGVYTFDPQYNGELDVPAKYRLLLDNRLRVMGIRD